MGRLSIAARKNAVAGGPAHRENEPSIGVPKASNKNKTAASALWNGVADKALQRQLRLLSHAGAVAKVGHWYLSVADGNVILSEEAHRIHGTDPGRFAPPLDKLIGLYHASERRGLGKMIDLAVETGAAFNTDLRVTLGTGETRHLRCNGSAECNDQGRIIGICGVVQDVTDIRMVEIQLREAKNLAEGADHAKTVFMGKLSHEFRTPLNNIIGFSELISSEMLGQRLPDTYKEYAQNILDSGNQLLESINQITDIQMLEDAVRRDEDSYRHLVDLSPDLICICIDGRITLMNSAGAGLLRVWDESDAKGQAIEKFVNSTSLDAFKVLTRTAGTRGRRVPVTMLATTGQLVDLEMAAVPMESSGENGVMFVGRDVTERNAALENAVARERQLQAVMDATADTIVTCDDSGIIVECNSAVEKDLGYAPEDLIGENVSVLMPPAHRDRHDGYIKSYIQTGQPDIIGQRREMLARRKDGTEIPVHIVVTRTTTTGRRLFIATIRSLSEERQLTERVTYLANYDTVTDLPNRALVRDRVEQAIALARRAGREVGVITFQINDFHMITGSLGPAGADEVLCEVARRLVDSTRPADTVGRVGTDSFVIVAANLAKTADVNFLVDRVNKGLNDPVEAGGEEIIVTCCSGASVHPRDGAEPDVLLRNSITALATARRLDLDGFGFFDDTMTAVMAERLTIERDLKKAVDREEFELHYQPQISMETGQLIGAEALIRWHHPRMGLLMPDRFIPAAEQSGAIVEIGEWVFRSACRQLSQWQKDGLPPLRMAINLSARQFRDGGLAAMVAEALDANAIAAARLELEITESLLMHDVDKAAETIRVLKGLGVDIAIDDFGTGHSSLAYLKRFAVDTLKIDKAFVKDIHENSDDEAIAVAIISLAHSLKMRTIAEGVEEARHAEILKAHGCDEIQGYFISRPVPAATFSANWQRYSLAKKD